MATNEREGGSESQAFGALLRRWRLAAGLSQEMLAERANLSRDAIAALERGRRGAPRAETLGLLSQALNLTPAQRDQLVDSVSAAHRTPIASAHTARTSTVSADQVSPVEGNRSATRTKPPSIPHNLPTPRSSFVGRAAELTDLLGVLNLRAPSTRLLTLVGAGGIGKTRLAIELARSLVEGPIPEADRAAELISDGIWLVDLSALDDPALVPAAAAAVLGVRDTQGQSVTSRLATVVGARRLLLLLDNCEHLIEACARLAETLLTTCPGLRVIATSREPLGIPGEVVWPVSPLSVFGSSALDDARAAASPGDAERLFVDRASAVQPHFTCTDENAPTIAAICQHLDGIPLAIELAAARVNALDLQTIADRLSDRFRFLTTGNRAGRPRHQTLRALVEWSYDLMAPDEQRLFARLAVFPGGWTLEAAEAVAGDDPPSHLAAEAPASPPNAPFDRASTEPLDVVELLPRLVDKSLVVPTTGRASRTRYRMLETLRHYALERLAASGETARRRQLHARYYLDRLAAAEPAIEGPEQAARLDRVEEDLENLRAALDWCVEADQAEPAFWGAWCLAILAWLRGYLNEIDLRLGKLLALPSAAVAPIEARARALVSAGYVAFYRGDVARARSLVEEGLSGYRQADQSLGIGQALTWLGLIVTAQGQYDHARACFLDALTRFEKIGDRFWTARAATNLGRCLNLAGDRAAAHGYLARALALRRELGDTRGVANTLYHLADGMLAAGKFAEAQALDAEALEIAHSIGDRFVRTRALIGLGRAHYASGDLALARQYLDEALTNAQRDGFGHDQAEVALLLGLIARDEGDLTMARAWAEDGLRRAKAGTQTPEAARALYLVGDIALCEGQIAEARASLRASLVNYRQIHHEVGIALVLATLATVAEPPARAARLAAVAIHLREAQVAPNFSIEWRELTRAIDVAPAPRHDLAIAGFDAVIEEVLST